MTSPKKTFQEIFFEKEYLNSLRSKYLLLEEQVFENDLFLFNHLALYFLYNEQFKKMRVFSASKKQEKGKLGPELDSGVIQHFQRLDSLITFERPNERSYVFKISYPKQEIYSLGLSKYTLNYLSNWWIKVEPINFQNHKNYK